MRDSLCSIFIFYEERLKIKSKEEKHFILKQYLMERVFKHSSETICFCSNLNEKLQNLIMKTTSLQHQLNGICPSDCNNTQRNPHINSEKDLRTLQDALKSLSFSLKVTLRQAKTQINSNRNTTRNALNLNPTTTPPFPSNERRMNVEKKQKDTRALYQKWEAISSFPKPLTKDGDKYTRESESIVGKGPDEIIKTSKKVLIKGPDGETKYCLCEKGTLPGDLCFRVMERAVDAGRPRAPISH